MQAQNIAISKLKNNTGQVPGLPKNPRFIRDARFDALKKSIEDDPEMLELRELIAYDYNGELVVIAGNMRLRAMKDLGYKEAPVKVLPPETPVEKLRAYSMKDNIPFGEMDWEAVANDWEAVEYKAWGLEVPGWDAGEVDYSGKNQEVDVDGFGDTMKLILEYTYDEYEQVKEALHRIAPTPEQAVFMLLNLESDGAQIPI